MNSQETQEETVRKSIVMAALMRIGTIHDPLTLEELREELDLVNQISIGHLETAMSALTTDRQVRAPLAQHETSLQPKKFLFVEPVVSAEALL